MSGKRPVFGIFEGGGAKGIAHIGALAAAEANDLEFAGVAGASAGAIVATLVAAGLSAKDILDPNAPGAHILAQHGTSTLGVLDEAAWRQFTKLRQAGLRFRTLLSPTVLRTGWGIYRTRGHFSTDGVRSLVNTVLRERLLDVYADAGLARDQVPDRILFKHLDYARFPIFRPLKIVATDLARQALTVFDQTLTPNVEIGEAVAASVAIPLIFQPVTITSYDEPGTGPFADGGLVSNAPIWVFAEEKLAIERAKPLDPPVPIIGFTLIDRGTEENLSGPKGTLGFLANLARTAIFGSQVISQRFIEDLVIVPLDVRLGLLAFDARWIDVCGAYRDGRRAAAEKLKATLTIRPARIRQELAAAHDGIRAEIDQHRAARAAPTVSHLRTNLIERAGRYSFRVTASFNMDADADDHLLLDVRGRGAPEAYRSRTLILLTTHPSISGHTYMTKYERALVRPTLRTMICTPIFREVDAWASAPADRPEPIGIFCVDSDDDLSPEFHDPVMQAYFVERSSVLSSIFE